jgi:small conductance mechanosensitive channel
VIVRGIIAIALLLCTTAVVGGQADRGVRVDGDLVFQVRASADLSADARAQQIESRLLSLLASPTANLRPAIRPSEPDGLARDIVVAGSRVATVTPDDGAANGVNVDRLANEWAEQIAVALERARERRTSPWQDFRARVRGSVRSAVGRLLETIGGSLPGVLAGFLVIAVVWAAAALVRRVLGAGIPRVVHDPTAQNFLREMAYYAVWAIGFLVALDAMGFNPQAFVTGLGLTGVALGFALKDILSNLVGGVLLQAVRPFELGDQIVVGSTEGSVERIDLRATHIRTYDGRLVLVPNGEVFTSRVTNNTASPVRRGSVEVHLDYRTDFPRALRIAAEAAHQTKGVAGDPPANARLRALNVGDAMMEVRFWTDSRRADFMATSCAVRVAVVLALKEAGIALPLPGGPPPADEGQLKSRL